MSLEQVEVLSLQNHSEGNLSGMMPRHRLTRESLSAGEASQNRSKLKADDVALCL
jgi:hypothetical protein